MSPISASRSFLSTRSRLHPFYCLLLRLPFRLPLFLLPLLLLSLPACYADELEEQTAETPFFDLAGYMSGQIDSLTALQPTVEKRVVLNGEEETRTMTDVNFANDLRALREADINKPAWVDKYVVEERDGAVLYRALDSTLTTQRLLVQFASGRPAQIDVYRKTGTLLSQGEQHLTYRWDYGYKIETDQKNRFGDDITASVSVRWPGRD